MPLHYLLTTTATAAVGPGMGIASYAGAVAGSFALAALVARAARWLGAVPGRATAARPALGAAVVAAWATLLLAPSAGDPVVRATAQLALCLLLALDGRRPATPATGRSPTAPGR